jgi:hypothetical protein
VGSNLLGPHSYVCWRLDLSANRYVNNLIGLICSRRAYLLASLVGRWRLLGLTGRWEAILFGSSLFGFTRSRETSLLRILKYWGPASLSYSWEISLPASLCWRPVSSALHAGGTASFTQMWAKDLPTWTHG